MQLSQHFHPPRNPLRALLNYIFFELGKKKDFNIPITYCNQVISGSLLKYCLPLEKQSWQSENSGGLPLYLLLMARVSSQFHKAKCRTHLVPEKEVASLYCQARCTTEMPKPLCKQKDA